jgi:hypothetical protein
MKSEIDKPLLGQRILLAMTLVIGVILMAYMIKVEGEPGALPLLLVITSIIWFFRIRLKINKHKI